MLTEVGFLVLIYLTDFVTFNSNIYIFFYHIIYVCNSRSLPENSNTCRVECDRKKLLTCGKLSGHYLENRLENHWIKILIYSLKQ